MEYRTPQPLEAEHEELHRELGQAIKVGGKIGEAARAVAKVMHSHFEKEAQFAMPPLGLLLPLSKGKITPEMAGVLQMTDRIKEELPEMLTEHRAIVGALVNLSGEARKENKMEYVQLAEKLILHARTEEEVLYPAAILVGDYLRLKLNKSEKG